MTGAKTAALPPGRMGLPFLGETPAFSRNLYAFLDDRYARYGPVFKSSIVGRRVVFLSGIAGAEAFYDPANITRSDAHPFPLREIFGGVNMEMYDGPKHLALKTMALGQFDHAAIAGYLPDMQALIESTLDRLSRAGELSAMVELRRLAIEAMCGSVLGERPGPRTEAARRDYALMVNGLASLPVALPGTRYGRARAARDRQLAMIREAVAERRARPGEDALSRLLEARAADGRMYADDEAVLEVHHMIIAGFVVYTLMAEAMRRLAEAPDLHRRCAEEVAQHAPSGPLTMEALGELSLSTNVVLETKRLVPLVPLAFGRAARTFTCGGHLVPEGWTVYLALNLNNRDAAVYREPDRFDPDRFGPGRAEHLQHALAFIPQGSGPHQCLGVDYATFLTLAFVTLLVRGYEWELPAQDFGYRWSTIPPEPRSGVRVRLRAKG